MASVALASACQIEIDETEPVSALAPWEESGGILEPPGGAASYFGP